MTSEDITDPIGIDERAPTKEAPAIPFEQAVMLRLDAIVALQTKQGQQLDDLCSMILGLEGVKDSGFGAALHKMAQFTTVLAEQGDTMPGLIAKELGHDLANMVMRVYASEMREIKDRLVKLEEERANGL